MWVYLSDSRYLCFVYVQNSANNGTCRVVEQNIFLTEAPRCECVSSHELVYIVHREPRRENAVYDLILSLLCRAGKKVTPFNILGVTILRNQEEI